jgi:hypothetical protein
MIVSMQKNKLLNRNYKIYKKIDVAKAENILKQIDILTDEILNENNNKELDSSNNNNKEAKVDDVVVEF